MDGFWSWESMSNNWQCTLPSFPLHGLHPTLPAPIRTQILQEDMRKLRMPSHIKVIFLLLYTHMYLGWASWPRIVLALALKRPASWETPQSQTNQYNLTPSCVWKVFRCSVYQNHLGHLVKIKVILLKMRLFWIQVGHGLIFDKSSTRRR